jgi:hypothetical protein
VPFPGHFCILPRKLLCIEIALPLKFSSKFSRKFTFSLYFPANDRKPTERQSFSIELQWKKYLKSFDQMSTAFSIEL